MDAVKFIEERNRMCKSFDNYCYDCPAWYGSCKLETGTHLECEADKAVKIVEDWSAAHPRKTRQSVFLEQYPQVAIYKGVIVIKPCQLVEGYTSDYCTLYGKSNCHECRKEFWMQEVE